MSTLIRRAAPGMALATVTLGAVWAFDPALHTAIEPTGSAHADDLGAPSGTSSGDAGGSTEPGASTDPGGSTDAGTSAGTDAGTDGSTDSAGASCDSAETLAGDPAYTQWGPVQVEMAVAADGTICAVEATAYPTGDRKSAWINASAIPQLDAMAVAQGTSFQAISGATYTSEAYRESMQSILDRL